MVLINLLSINYHVLVVPSSLIRKTFDIVDLSALHKYHDTMADIPVPDGPDIDGGR
jgi:hypothetical protein